MPQLTLDVPHTLGREEAARRLKAKAEFVQGAFQSQVGEITQQWQEDTLSFGFKAMGMKVSGTLVVEDAVVRLAADLPWAAMMLKGTIQERARQELTHVLS
jgi:hypothetical protein